MGSVIKVGGFGNLSIAADLKAPLLVVFGGKNVDGRESGVYMWDFMSKIQNKYHIFVAVNQHVNGLESYNKLMETVTTDDHHLTPAQQFLYLFSGGWSPGEGPTRAPAAAERTHPVLGDLPGRHLDEGLHVLRLLHSPGE